MLLVTQCGVSPLESLCSYPLSSYNIIYTSSVINCYNIIIICMVNMNGKYIFSAVPYARLLQNYIILISSWSGN